MRIKYQLFIEPKGAFISEHDRWKEDSLREISRRFKGKRLAFGDRHYSLIGLPFYNIKDENPFKESLESELGCTESSAEQEK